MTRAVALYGAATSLVIELAGGGTPLWRYWGPRLASDFVAGPPLRDERPQPGFLIDSPPRLALVPGGGLGWFQHSAITAHRDGRLCHFDPGAVALTEADDQLIFAMTDSVSALSVQVTLSLDAHSDVLTLATLLTNIGDEPLDLSWLASGVLPLSDNSSLVRYYTGRHANEFILREDRLGAATWLRENRRGITSHDMFPGAVVASAGASAHDGVVCGAQLAWSGNHRQLIEPLDDGRWQWQLGLAFAPGEMNLAPGESFAAPVVLATCSSTGWGGAARNFHAAIRARMAWPAGRQSPRPVHFNTWEGSYFDHDEAAMMARVDRAAALGVERFILDDGWFQGRSDDRRALGDWRPDAEPYPAGLAPLAQHVVDSGMTFGLWIEPEMVNPDSQLYRAHPDWVLSADGRAIQTSRHQLVLDIARPEVSEYIFATIAATIRDLPLSYLKWDHNRDLTAACSGGRAAYYRHTQAFYDLVRRFRAAFPHIEIESCAGGGGRIDAGIATLVHRFWPSDNLDALSRLAIQQGFLQFMPPELMGAHIGTAPSHSTGRSQPLDFRAAVACQGHFGIELDLDRLLPGEADRIGEWIAFYRHWRSLLHQQVWTGDTRDGLVWHAAGNCDEWLLFLYRVAPTGQRFMPPVRLPLVDQTGCYRVMTVTPGRDDLDARFDGSWLAHVGLPSPPFPAERAAIFHGKRI